MSKITVTVSGETGACKSAIALEIEIALKAIGVPAERVNPDMMVHAESQTWIDMYKPEVKIVEVNIPRGRQPGWMGDIGGTPYGPYDR